MKTALLLVALAAGASAAAISEADASAFYDYMLVHDKAYTDGSAFVAALDAWKENDKTINEHNAKGLSYTLGHNKYSDMTWEEFRSVMNLGQARPKKANKLLRGENRDVFTCEGECAKKTPDAVDWTTEGAVTPVKDQGSCGSCWSFSTTGSLEGAYFLAGNDLTSFSEQMLVDCDHNGDMGCNGGLMDNAFGWIESNGGICTEDDYPYDARTGTCQSSTCSVVSDSAPSTYTDVAPHSVSSLEAAVAQQPVSIAIEADQAAFQLYQSGVMDGTCGSQLDHGVLAVGYGTDEATGEAFWKVKNSWGESWGEDGYIRLAKGTDSRNGECGILDDPSFPTINEKAETKKYLPSKTTKSATVKSAKFADLMTKKRVAMKDAAAKKPFLSKMRGEKN